MWQGDIEVLNEIISLISDAVSSSNNIRQQEIASRITVLSEYPQYPCYLLAILTSQNIPLTVRLASGHSLKSALERRKDLPVEILLFLEENILRSLSDESISSAICSIASTFYVTQEGWPKLLQYLADNINSKNSIITLAILFEDISTYSALSYLLSTPDYSEHITNLVHKLLELSQNGIILAIKCVNQLLEIMPVSLMPFVEKYLSILLSIQVNEYVAEGIFTLSCSRKDIIKKYFSQCGGIMINFMNTEKGAIGCNFWMEVISEKELVIPFLQPLLFTILGNLKLTDADIMLMMPDTEEFRFEKEASVKN